MAVGRFSQVKPVRSSPNRSGFSRALRIVIRCWIRVKLDFSRSTSLMPPIGAVGST